MAKPVIFAVGPEFRQREGLTETVQTWEDGQRASTAKGSFEWWYFDAHFDDHTTVVIVFATKPLIDPNTELTPNLALTITRSDGTKNAQFSVLPAGEFSAAREMCDVRIGPNWVRQTGIEGPWEFSMHAEVTGMSADLVFKGLVPPWRPGAGKSFFGDLNHYFAWLPSIPFGTVEGTLTYDGQTRQVRGTGYHDHNWGNVSLPAVMDHWYWGRAHLGDYSLIFVEQIALRKYSSTRMPVFLLAKGDQILVEDAQYLTMQARDFIPHTGGRQFPREVDFIWANGHQQIRLELRKQKLIEGTSLLIGLPRWKQVLARLAANPYYFRFNTELNLKIDLDGLHDEICGPALYEIMMLR